MTAQDCLALLRQVKDVAFATVDASGLPQVRIIDVMLVEQDALYFCTARGKAFYHQLLSTGQVAVAALTPAYQMIRLSGRVRHLDGQRDWIDRIFVENPAMETVYPGQSRYILEPFCLDNGQMEVFDLGQQPIHRESFALGGGDVQEKGFVITSACIGCGKCQRGCPQNCIESGAPFSIVQAHCLHCGLCQELCPVQAIQTRGAGT
ncbi:MAG TPA: 4Fe-4S binding protein [Candidatus Enterenecus merdae]|nr:4Fe-4S binding protein [Candidatus Enterenecus merdae]